MRSEYIELDAPRQATNWKRRVAVSVGALVLFVCLSSLMVSMNNSNMKISWNAPSHLTSHLAVNARPATATAKGSDELFGETNDVLPQNEYLGSTNDAYFAVMQADGNFVVYVSHHFTAGNALWSSGTHGKGVGPFRLVMQSDNNLVIYDSRNVATWASGTHNRGVKPARLVMQSDGNLVIYDAKGTPIWHTNTWRRLKALLQRLGFYVYHEDDPKEVAKRLKAMKDASKQKNLQ